MNVAPVVLSIGNFDGLHRGHQYLLEKNMELAAAKKGRSMVLSFLPHPMQVIRPESFCSLSSLRDQELGLEQLGIDDWIMEPFTESLREESSEDFFERLRASVNLCAIVVGPDFHFGKDRSGDVNFLRQMGALHRIEIVTPEDFTYQGARVSSSKVRHLLRRGEVDTAMALLGRPYALRGIVVTGFHRGRKIGFPTANILSAQAANLRLGVYRTFVYVRGEKWKAVTNVGRHPTFGEDADIQVESHLLDFNESLYGAEIKIEFMEFLRPEIKFSDIEALISQIQKDVQLVRQT